MSRFTLRRFSVCLTHVTELLSCNTSAGPRLHKMTPVLYTGLESTAVGAEASTQTCPVIFFLDSFLSFLSCPSRTIFCPFPQSSSISFSFGTYKVSTLLSTLTRKTTKSSNSPQCQMDNCFNLLIKMKRNISNVLHYNKKANIRAKLSSPF